MIKEISPCSSPVPDVAVILGEAALQPARSGFPTAPPTIIVEGTAYRPVDAKVAEWLQAGSAVVKIVNARRRTVAQHHSNVGHDAPSTSF